MAHPKGVLIERLQKEGRQPRFESRMSGPDHEPVFDAEVLVDDEVLGRGRGTNKRTAERAAAEEALRALDAGPKRRSRKRGGAKTAAETPAPAPEAPAPTPVPDDEPFEGPWPVFDTVLATSLRIAHDRIAAGLASDDARERIEAFALTLYKNVLQDLGDVVEEEEAAADAPA